MDYIDKIQKLCITLMVLVAIFVVLTGVFILKLGELKADNEKLQEEAWNFYYELDDLKQDRGVQNEF